MNEGFEPSLPVICEGIDQVICLEHGREAVDLDHMAEFRSIHQNGLKRRVVIMGILKDHPISFLQPCGNLIKTDITAH